MEGLHISTAPKRHLPPHQRKSQAPKPHTVLQVWISAELDASGHVRFSGTSDSELSRGLCAVLVAALSGLTPEEVLQVSQLFREEEEGSDAGRGWGDRADSAEAKFL